MTREGAVGAPLLKVASASASAGGVPALLGGILLVETGVPVPVPADLLVLILGERASAGALPLWLAVALLELVAVVGTTLLFVMARGPARLALERVAQRVGLSPARLAGAAARLEGRGASALVIGRATPGFRTLTVIAASATRLRTGNAVVPLLAGSTIFLQGHVLLGYAFGPTADSLLAKARVGLVVVLVALLVAGGVVWLARRGRRDGERGFAEASCPACLAVAAVRGALVTQTAERATTATAVEV